MIFVFFLIFLIVLFLSKLLNYVIKFKIFQDKSKADVIFLITFFTFLFIPMSYIDNADVSESENRRLAKFYPLVTKDRKFNYNFGKDFDAWFNDRFFMRYFFIEQYNLRLLLSENWQRKNVMKGKQEWLFLAGKEAIESYLNDKLFDVDELDAIKNYLVKLDDYCETQNKKFYFFIVPDKSRIYEEFYSDKIRRVSSYSKTEQLIDYLKENSDIKIIYPKDRLKAAKSEKLLYWKTDTHWNLLGSYYGYLELMDSIAKDFPKIKTYTFSQYRTEKVNGDLYRLAPRILRKEDETVYIVPDVTSEDVCQTVQNKDEVTVECHNSSAKYNLLMFKDSFAEALIPYLAHTFRYSKYVSESNVSPYSISDADVVVLEIVERNIADLVINQME